MLIWESGEERPVPHAVLRLFSKLMPSKYLKNISVKGIKLLAYPIDPYFSVQLYLSYEI